MVILAFVLAGVGVAAYGLVRHESRYWSLGTTWLGVQLGIWLMERGLRKYEPNPTGLERTLVAIKAFALILPLTLGVSIGFMLLFPTWFPDASPIPPSH